MIVNNGLNLVRDLICGASSTYVDNAGFGTGTDAPTEYDTGLNTNTNLGTAGTTADVTAFTSDKQIKFEHILTAASGNGSTFTEFGLNNGTILFNRVKMVGFEKTADEEWDTICLIRVERS